MSASLVGSEMCIRDRFCHARLCLLANPVFLDCGKRRCNPASTLAIRPVSYTHLTLPTICSV
eukprot:8462028-Alexandrium_andersonii.AAC.1